MMKIAAKLSVALLVTIPVNSVFAGGHMKGWEATGTQIPFLVKQLPERQVLSHT
tara:strand:- start:434 stop:595 length:162 start_codon:yes stop_codon:yes gene_type:complete